MLKKTELKEFRAILLALQARLRGDVAQLTDEALEQGESGGDSKSPTHIAELGTEKYEPDFSLRLAEKDHAVPSVLPAARKRVDTATFGLCEACLEEGKPPSKSLIPKTRLRAIPYARNCIACERKREELTL